MRSTTTSLALLAALAVAGPLAAQTTIPGPAIDVEIYNPADGSNAFCVAPGDTFWARLHVRPASGPGTSIDCLIHCGTTAGGPANIASAAIDLAYDRGHLSYLDAINNTDPVSAALDGLPQTLNTDEGRVGWALAGDWTPDGDLGGVLADPCQMRKLDQADWVAQVGFSVMERGETQLDLANEPEFPLSFADVCGSPAFTASSGGVDEVVPASVSTECPSTLGIIFRNGVETGDPSVWTASFG